MKSALFDMALFLGIAVIWSVAAYSRLLKHSDWIAAAEAAVAVTFLAFFVGLVLDVWTGRR